jgi:acetyl/propionyl-CoA carboxylase alpha subunit
VCSSDLQSLGRQKRIEVAPGFDPASFAYAFDAARVLDDITRHSITMALAVGYDNVGTWEWIVTPKGDPFLMEVNTRIQVENGVSAAIARIKGQDGVNLIREQIRLGLGEEPGYTQSDISFSGVGIEYRIIAEDTVNRFAPWTGRIDRIAWTEEPWLKMHTHVPQHRAYQIPTEYDPNLALAIIWGKDLEEAKARGIQFLDAFRLEGMDAQGTELKSNIAFLREKTNDLLEF